LAGPLTNTATTCFATSGGGSLFPAITGGSGDSFQMTFSKVVVGVVTAQEIVTVTARSADTFTIVRGQEGTTALSWNAGDSLALLPTAGDMASFLQPADVQAAQAALYGIDSGSLNAYVVSLTPALTAHVQGLPISFLAGSTNTGASTLNDGAGAAALTALGAPLLPGMVAGNGVFTAVWNGSAFVLQNPALEAFATAAAASALASAETFAENASNISSGTVANAHLPNVGAGPGVTIQADPGTTPSGVFGDLFLYY
jgi:hypothetical protein